MILAGSFAGSVAGLFLLACWSYPYLGWLYLLVLLLVRCRAGMKLSVPRLAIFADADADAGTGLILALLQLALTRFATLDDSCWLLCWFCSWSGSCLLAASLN